MPMIMPTHLSTLGKTRTPDEFKKVVQELLGPALEQYTVCGTDVLFVTYIEPDVTAGGIAKPNQSQQEILFQGSVGLVVGLGPLAFKYDSKGFKWDSDGEEPRRDKAKIGDWIVVRFADCWEMHLAGVSCRLVDPENVRGIIASPEIITHRPPAMSSVTLSGAVGGSARGAAWHGLLGRSGQ